MELGPDEIRVLDTTRPNIARVWDYWLGGKDNFTADREQAEEMLRVNPLAARMARENRQFLDRAVSYVARQGISQFVDVGAGLPTAINTHEIARRISPDAKVAYLDNDPLVVRHAEALLAKDPGVIAMLGDARDPQAILAEPGLNKLIDLAAPVCVVLCGVLHFLDVDTARKTAATFARAAAPGSYVIISVGTGDPDLSSEFAVAYRAGNLHMFSPDEFASFFDGLEVVPPGLLPARGWTGGQAAPPLLSRQASFLVGVGRKAR